MFDQFLPVRVDNTYRGYKVALWLFGLVVFVKAVQSLASIFNGYSVATSADGIPVDTFTSAGARTVVSLFAALGLSQFMICLLCTLVLVRYRSMVPVMFALVLLQHLGGRLIAQFLPIVRTGRPPGVYINLALVAAMIVGLALSLRSQGNPRVQPS
jgi:hypothetical protein